MRPSKLVIDQDWLCDEAANGVIKALSADGGTARYVGGCVRDAVLGRPVRDLDIATDSTPQKVISLLEAAGLKAIPTGIEHGTITAVAGGRPFEITTLRVDVETFGRHAAVAFTDDWKQDAQRRDFTLNALFCDPDGRVYDPVGGIKDLKAGHVRFIGDARKRIEEDALRILRFFRFHAWFGQGELDNKGLQACVEAKRQLANLSVERVRSEILRLLEAPNPLETLDVMIDASILALVLPEAFSSRRLDALVSLERVLKMSDPLRRLAALTNLTDEKLTSLGSRWRFSNADQARLAAMAGRPDSLPPGMSDEQMRESIYRGGAEPFCDRALLAWASDGQGRDRFLAFAKEWVVPVFPLMGREVVARGVGEGEAVGKLLSALEDWWIENGFVPGKSDLLEQLDLLIDT